MTITKLINAVRVVNAKGSRLYMKKRPSGAIILTLRGKIEFKQNGLTIVAEKNKPVLLPEGSEYINECIEAADSLMINFSTAPCDSVILSESSSPLVCHLPESDFSEIVPVFNLIFDYSEKALAIPPTKAETFFAISKLYEILSMIYSSENPRNCKNLLFEKASEFISQRISDCSLSCAETAKALDVSEVYLRKIFKRYTGLSTGKYIAKIRLEKARMLLRERVTVKSVCESVGYSDVYCFSRAYTNYFGYPPSKTKPI